MIHIKKFIDSVQTASRSNQRQIILNIRDAESLSYDLNRLLIDYIDLQKENVDLKKQESSTDIEMDGGNW